MATQEQINEIVSTARCTLDGERATVVGRLCEFATVRSLQDSARSAEFAWDTVVLILAKGGEFRS